MKTLITVLFGSVVAAAVALPAAALACGGSCANRPGSSQNKGAGTAAATVAEAPPNASNARTVAMTVTDNGFEPSEVKVKKGEPVRLVITRKTDATCATSITVDGTDIRRDLPLNEPVEVTFTPAKAGDLRYGCGMNKMVGGVLKVQ